MSQDRETTLLPPGVRVYLPPDSRTKRRHLCRLLEEARDWGFQELDIPTLDFYESITRGVSENLAHRTYQFHDDEGELLALRPDATAQVAKILSGRFSRGERPGRYCYATRTFRSFELRRGELREFHQFGAEILSEDRFQSDLELLVFMFEQLEKFGLDDVVVDLGHVQIYTGLMDDVDLTSSQSNELRKKIHRKNVHGLRDLLENLPLSDSRKRILLELPTLFGGEEIFDRIDQINGASERSRAALDHLHRVYRKLEQAGYGDWISLDLGVVRDLDYYTGIVFEALLPGIGKPVVGGGRYDGLYGVYGDPIPATGFAVEMDRLLPVLEEEEAPPKTRKVFCPEPTPEALQALRDFREDGPARVEFDDPPIGEDVPVIHPDGSIESPDL